MEIHKPKPWHGWREFLKEIGTIVIGVLIALGAEQAVEWAHRQNELAETRESLRDEMVRNATAMKLTIEEGPCVQSRLDRVAAWAKGGPSPIWDAGALMGLSSSAWEVAKAGVVAHMPLKERIAYDTFYADVANRAEISRNERNTFADLTRYMAEPQVALEDRRRALQDVARAKAQVGLIVLNDQIMLSMAKGLGGTPRAYSRRTAAHLAQLCDSPSASVRAAPRGRAPKASH